MELTDTTLSSILNDFEQLTSKPETFVSIKENLSQDIKEILKQTYDIAKTQEVKSYRSNALPELIIHNFDEEQIFQQIELQNENLLSTCISKVSKLAVAKDKLLFSELDNDIADPPKDRSKEQSINDDEIKKSDLAENLDVEDDIDEDGLDYSEDDEESGAHDEDAIEDENKKAVKPSVVDDKFFKLNEMNDFLISQEKDVPQKKKISQSESESEADEVDMFEASENENEEIDFEGNDKLKNPRYKDFFRDQNAQKHWDTLDDVQNEEENVDYVKSTLELREERLQRKIGEIEDAAVSEKPWQLKGEVTGENRPLNSLLEEVLEFDLTTRPAPVITEETTLILEDVIRQRIKDKAFDDVLRKQKPTDTPLEFKKKLVLDQEKSKQSLAQIYENEYLKQKEALTTDQSEKEEIEPKLHLQIKSMMHSLFTKLDSLSNFHFTPKPVIPELRVVNNLPAITMEEVAPVASTDASLLAPQEVQRKVNGDIIGKSERTKSDKKRERRKKKSKQREHAHEKIKKENAISKLRPGLGNKYSKENVKKIFDRVTKDVNVDKMDHSFTKKIKSSSAFFSQLQENVTSHIKQQTKSKNSNKNKKRIDAKKIKL